MFLVGSAANADIGVRQGRHGDMGRLVFDFPGVETFSTQRSGDVLMIQFTPPQPMASTKVNVPGVTGLQGGNGFVKLSLARNAEPHVYRIGNRVVVDATQNSETVPMPHANVAATQASQQTAIDKPPVHAPTHELPHKTPVMIAKTTPPAAAPAPPPPEPPSEPRVTTGSLPTVSALPLAMPALVPDAAMPAPEEIDFQAEPGAAAFRRGNQAIIVFDTSEVPDISALQSEPAFASAALVSLQDAQVITLPLPAKQALALTAVTNGWQIAVVAAPAASAAGLPPPPSPGGNLEISISATSQTVTVSDPLTGADLLVGTVTHGGAAAAIAQSGPGFAVLPAWLGVAVLPQADNIGLNITPTGFELSALGPAGLRLGAMPPATVTVSATPHGAGLNLPNGDTAGLRNQMSQDLHAAAIFAPLGRLTAQIALASDMIALGLGPEARGVLDTAVLENPAAQDNGRIASMRAVADVLAGRYNPADFKAPGIPPTGELAFWNAAGQASQGATARAGPALAANIAAFEAYPASLRNAMNAQIGESLADANELQAAQQLVNFDPANPLLDLTRAKLLERQGQSRTALVMYQKLIRSKDSRIAAIAADRAVELKLRAGAIKPSQAADALDAQIFDWRDPEHERHLRLRVAQLRARAGQWQQAFNTMQAARTRFPDHQTEIDADRSAMFLNMLSSQQFTQLPPIQAVAILQQNQDLIPAGAGSADVVGLLAQQLGALDLPGAAAPMLSHLIQSIPPGIARARLGARLAQVDLDAGSPVATLADLAQTQADGLPADLAAQRAILNAKAQAAGGNAVAAVTNLNQPVSKPAATFSPTEVSPPASTADSPLPASPASLPGSSTAPANANPASLETQAQIAEQSGQWPQAEQALGALVNQSVPNAGPVTGDQENLLLRLATAASHNNDSAMLTSLASQYGTRVSADPAGQMFQALTTPTLNGDQGLNQALHEIAQLQALPAMLNAVAATPTKTSGTP